MKSAGNAWSEFMTLRRLSMPDDRRESYLDAISPPECNAGPRAAAI